MKYLAALLMLTVPAHAGTITCNLGGSGAAALEMARQPQRIDGPCLSACAWAFLANPRACFTHRAVFWFHAWRDPGTGARMPAAERVWLDRVGRPAWLVLDEGVDAVRMGGFMPERRCGE